MPAQLSPLSPAEQAKRRYDTVRNFRLHNNLKEVFDLYRHEKCIYVLRIKKTGTPGPREKKGAASDGANIESGK